VLLRGDIVVLTQMILTCIIIF